MTASRVATAVDAAVVGATKLCIGLIVWSTGFVAISDDDFSRVAIAQVSLPDLPFAGWADLVFSTATFHWIKDHPALFAGIFSTLRRGGRLHAQCGGGPNLCRAHALAEEVMHADPFAPYFGDWPGPWEFANAEVTADRLRTAGFLDIDNTADPTTIEQEPAEGQRDTPGFTRRVEKVIDVCRHEAESPG